MKSKDSFFQIKNPVIYLVASNFLVLIFALFFGWSMGEIIWTFLIQGIIIGLFVIVRILDNSSFSITAPNPHLSGLYFWGAKIIIAGLFAVHFGAIHFACAGFIAETFGGINPVHVIISGVLFAVPHFVSYAQNRSVRFNDRLGLIMTIPYIRVLPMYVIMAIALIAGLESRITIAAFIVVKTFVDVKMHHIERKLNEDASVSFAELVRNAARKH